jgi:hypothetical protein
VRSALTELRSFYAKVEHETAFKNVFHCCVQKTGSVWIMSILSDPIIHRYSGLSHFRLSRLDGPRPLRAGERTFDEPFPPKSIVSPLYNVTYDNFTAIPKPDAFRAFFVVRDPRDLIVSWYFSSRSNHIVGRDGSSPLAKVRHDLSTLKFEEGLKYGIDYWDSNERFEVLASWVRGAAVDPNVRLVRFEDLAGSQSFDAFRDLFRFVDVPIPDAELADLLEAYSFESLTGRRRGQVDDKSHLRAGKQGQWAEHFSSHVESYFSQVAGDLLAPLGYWD